MLCCMCVHVHESALGIMSFENQYTKKVVSLARLNTKETTEANVCV